MPFEFEGSTPHWIKTPAVIMLEMIFATGLNLSLPVALDVLPESVPRAINLN